jgi:hypothetical protein
MKFHLAEAKAVPGLKGLIEARYCVRMVGIGCIRVYREIPDDHAPAPRVQLSKYCRTAGESSG